MLLSGTIEILAGGEMTKEKNIKSKAPKKFISKFSEVSYEKGKYYFNINIRSDLTPSSIIKVILNLISSRNYGPILKKR